MEYRSSDQVLKELQENRYKPVYILHGEEAYFIDEISDFIEKNALTEAEKAFNQVVVYGREVEFKQIYDEARQFPMMAQRRVVIVKEAQDLKQLKELERYISAPADQTVLVLCHKNKNIDGRIKWVKLAKKDPNLVIFNSLPIKDWNLSQWINQYLRNKNRKITPKANQMLCEYLGTDIKKLVNEIAKVELNVGIEKVIDEDDIEKHVGISKEYNVFELLKALNYRSMDKSLFIAQNLMDNIKKNPLPMLLSPMSTNFMRVLIVQRNIRSRDEELAKMINTFKGFVRDIRIGAKSYKETSIRKIITLIKETDAKSKGVGNRSTEHQEMFKELVLNILLLP